MTARFDDLPPSDAVELGMIWRDNVLSGMRVDCGTQIEEFFAEREDVKWGVKKQAEIADEVADIVIAWMRSSKGFASFLPPGVMDFVDALGNHGWEILHPRRARQVQEILAELNVAMHRALTKGQERATTRRRPRVKKLKENV